MADPIQQAKHIVLQGCAAMCGRGYVLGTSGNISARVAGKNLFVITPTSIPYEDLEEDDLVVAGLDGAIVAGRRKPSIEFAMHRVILSGRPDVGCVVHTHSKYATAVSAMEGVRAVPVIDIETALYIGGDIAVAPFAAPGSEELAASVAASIGDRAGVIMEGHGAIGVGRTMRDAMVANDILERNCELFLLIRAAGEIKPLPPGSLEAICALSRQKRGIDNKSYPHEKKA